MLTPCVFNDLGGSGSRPSISLYNIKRGEGQKNIICFPKVVSYDGEAFHVLEFDQHDFCVSRTLPRRSLTSDFVSKREERRDKREREERRERGEERREMREERREKREESRE